MLFRVELAWQLIGPCSGAIHLFVEAHILLSEAETRAPFGYC